MFIEELPPSITRNPGDQGHGTTGLVAAVIHGSTVTRAHEEAQSAVVADNGSNHLSLLPESPSKAHMISIVVPCRNESRAIERFLESILKQDLADLQYEVIVADGMSDDGTHEILEKAQEQHPYIRLIDNPTRIVSTGLNAAIYAARGDIIVRMDVHTEYKEDYIRRCVEVLGITGADNVGGACIAKGKGYVGSAIAAAFQCAFAVGGARWHRPGHKGPVDTVHLGCWRREVLQEIGFFDESLVRNQDDELNLRIVRAGGTIWQEPEIVSWYHPRSSFASLFRQYFQYGFWKVAVIRKHRLPASWRHLVPGAFVLANGLFLAALALRGVSTLAWPAWSANFGAVMDTLYVCASLFFAFITARVRGWALLPLLPLVFAIYHIAYGLGFLAGTVYFTTKPRYLTQYETVFTRLTR
jgi:cellulose synthase/poly-beta-1,6-N-acetylglucosamine synthase-like glycosyltransferase